MHNQENLEALHFCPYKGAYILNIIHWKSTMVGTSHFLVFKEACRVLHHIYSAGKAPQRML